MYYVYYPETLMDKVQRQSAMGRSHWNKKWN